MTSTWTPITASLPAPGIVGRNLRRILAEENITQGLLAEWVGVHTNSVQNWMRGRDPGATKLYKAAQVLRRDRKSVV